MDSIFSFVSAMLITFVNTSAGFPTSRDLADVEKFSSTSFLSPQEIDLHVAHLTQTEPRHDRLGRDAIEPAS